MNVQKSLIISAFAAVLQVASIQTATAKNLVCISAGYCTTALSCNTKGAGEKLNVKIMKGNRAEFGWDGTDAKFTAKGQRKKNFTVYATSSDTSLQTFVLADDMSASMGVTTHLLDQLYNSFHALTCREANE